MVDTIIYIRTSTDEQNPGNQLADCISINKYGEYQVYEEQQSAYKDFEQRTKFTEIVRLIKQKKVKHFIVWDLDRIYRNRSRLNEFFKICSIYGCSIHSFRQQWLSQINDMPSPFNEIVHDLMLQIMGWIAEEESKHKSMRVRAAIRLRNDGAYSYKGNKWGRKRISTMKQNIINKMYADGQSIRSIAKEASLSIGVVHKYIHESLNEKQGNKEVHS